jgi:hypothetical protein
VDECPWIAARAPMCAKNKSERFAAWSAACSLRRLMTRALPPTYIELTLDDHDDGDSWFDEKTARFDFDKPNLTAEDRLVIGYLTMEANDLFGHLSVEEQQKIASALKR